MHYGSPLEIEYALKSYGINLAGCLELPNGGGEQELSGPLSRRELEEHIRRLEENEEEWRQKEAPYRDSSSPIALFPNPQDIIMGKSRKKLAATFPGNLAFNKIIKAQALHYSNEEERGFKTAIVMGVIHHLQNDLGARFLTRKDTCWEVVDATEVRQKVSQALRDEVKLIMKHRKQRCE